MNSQKLFLLIDNSPAMQKVMHLAFSGYIVKIETKSMHDEIEVFLTTKKPDLVFVDAQLLELSMQKILATLQASLHFPLVILHGQSDFIDQTRLKSVGLNRLSTLKKPFDFNGLKQTVEAILGRPLEKEIAKTPHFVPPPPTAAQVPSHLLREKKPDKVTTPSPEPAVEKLTHTMMESLPHATSNIEKLLKDELLRKGEHQIEDFCKNQLPQLAKQIILEEIRRLAQERLRVTSGEF